MARDFNFGFRKKRGCTVPENVENLVVTITNDLRSAIFAPLYGVPFYFLFPIYGYPKFIFGYPLFIFGYPKMNYGYP